jgi:hypothetical protein
MTNLKTDYNYLMRRYESIKDHIAEAKAQKKQAKADIVEIDEELATITKGKDVTEIIIKLEKEIEIRKQGVNDKIIELENVVEANISGNTEDSLPTIDDILEGDESGI